MALKNLCRVYVVVASLSGVHAATVNAPKVIDRDVIVIGGGAAGSHAAFRLQQDYNKTVVLIEKEAILVSLPLPLSPVEVPILTSSRAAT